jgi:Domain of unknown function (DUF6745)
MEAADRLALGTVDWRAAAFATGPGDRTRIMHGIRAAYAGALLAVPACVAWLPSPLHGVVAAALVTDPAARKKLLAAGLGAQVGLAERVLAECHPPRPAAAGARSPAGAPVRELVRTLPWEASRSAVHADLGPVGWSRACAGKGALWDQVNGLVARIRRGLGELGGTRAGPLLRQAALEAVLGQHDAPWLALFGQLGRLGGLEGLALVAAEAGWWWPYEDLVIVSERPLELHRDELGRLHRGDGPALVFSGGFELHAWRGMPMPAGFAVSLGTLSPERIAGEENAELRRVMLECYGFDRYLADTGATPLGRDQAGVLWRIDLPGDEPVVMVEVVNATAEPDGTRRTYWLRVPPDTRTAREGVAWTFGLTAGQYKPMTQT